MANGATGGGQAAGTIKRYDPPAFMTDFDKVPGLRDQWSEVVSAWFDEMVEAVSDTLKKRFPDGDKRCQYYNQLKAQHCPGLEQSIVWNAFSGTLLRRYGEANALEIAETLIPLTERQDGQGAYNKGPGWDKLLYRPQDEYCEWRVERNEEGKITRVTFTSEPPEYWQALHGDKLPGAIKEGPVYPVDGDPQLVLDLYREFVSPKVEADDLVFHEDMIDTNNPEEKPVLIYPKGAYNPYNRWNTTDGIMHLTQPANSLSAEIWLGGEATILYERFGRRITDPDALICATRYGGANRCSDPVIGCSVNELAALGCWITLRNPVGLYMSHLEMSGWTKPSGEPIDPEYFRVLRGDEKRQLIERAVFEVPEDEGFTVSDIRIGGVPITHGGQLAQYMTVHLVGLASEPGAFKPEPLSSPHAALVSGDNPGYLIQPRPDRPPDPQNNEEWAFAYPDVSS